MSSQQVKYDAQKLKILEDLRLERSPRVSLQEMADYFDLKDRRTVRSWELGRSLPNELNYRSIFIVYLLDVLRLRQRLDIFQEVWNDVMFEQWEWEPLSRDELANIAPGSINSQPPNTHADPIRVGIPYIDDELVGRDQLIPTLRQRLFNAGSMALTGLPGVGKTALMVHLVNDPRVVNHYADGILWAKLGRDGDTITQLSRWAMALGIPISDIAEPSVPQSWGEAIYDRILAKRYLLVIDDAWSYEAAANFKLGGPNCIHVVTTRSPELAVQFAPDRIEIIPELDNRGGLNLLERLAPSIVRDEPEGTSELINLVGGLPLALKLMGNFLRVRSLSGQQDISRNALVALQEVETRLHLEEPQVPTYRHPSLQRSAAISLEAVIAISDQALSDDAQYALRSLSVFPAKPNTFSEIAGLAVTDRPSDAINELYGQGLLEKGGANRYTLHQTIADYADYKRTDETSIERMIDYFVRYAQTHESDFQAFDAEQQNVISALQQAADRKMLPEYILGSNSFAQFLIIRGLYSTAKDYLEPAYETAKSINESSSAATSLLKLGMIGVHLSNYKQAENYYSEALQFAKENDDTELVSRITGSLGVLELRRSNLHEAERYCLESVLVAERLTDSGLKDELMSKGLMTSGGITYELGNFEQSESRLTHCLDIARRTGDKNVLNGALTNLGSLELRRGDYIKAERYSKEALPIARELKYLERQAGLLQNLGKIAVERGNYVQAEKDLDEALALAYEVKQQHLLSQIQETRGELFLFLHKFQLALDAFVEAQKIAQDIQYDEIGINARCGIIQIALLQNNKTYEQVVADFNDTLNLARELKQPVVLSHTLIIGGELYLQYNELDLALDHLTEALEIARQVESYKLIADVLYIQSRISIATDDLVQAIQPGQECLAIFQQIGHRLTDQVREMLEAISSNSIDNKTETDNSIDEY